MCAIFGFLDYKGKISNETLKKLIKYLAISAEVRGTDATGIGYVNSGKNEYCGHFCLGIIYSRSELDKYEKTKIYTTDDIKSIPAVIHSFVFFAEEKWKIASDKSGSGNTANIGSIQKIDDILTGNGVFAKAGEELFDDYWANFGKIEIPDKKGGRKKLSSFSEYLAYRGLPETLNNPKASKKKGRNNVG